MLNVLNIELYKSNWLINTISIISEVVKFKITIMVTLTTSLGFILGSQILDCNIIYPVTGVFLLACGSSALNQFQECTTDKIMTRTQKRPIPSGRINKKYVLLLSLFLIPAGSLTLFFKAGITAFLIGIFTVLWYNGVYTYLKRKTSFAVIYGSLVGALPPVIGWAATGSNILDLKILLIGFYFFIWQIPHFWLIIMIYSEDYKRAGFPVINEKLSQIKMKILTFLLIIMTSLTSSGIMLSGILNYIVFAYFVFFMSLVLILNAIIFLKSLNHKDDIYKIFISLNIFTLFFTLILITDKLIILLN